MSRYRLRPSSAGVWALCPGSVVMSEPYPQDETPESREGTAAHWVAARAVRGDWRPVGSLCPNGQVVTEEMLEGAGMYVEAIEDRFPLEMAHVEEEYPAPDIHEQNGGTVDAWGLVPGVLHVMDYKFGHGYVNEFENWQGIDYVSAVVSHLIRTGVLAADCEDYLSVEITIVQPRNYHRDGPVRSWRLPLKALRAQFNVLRGSAAEAVGTNPRTIVGEHCTYCAGRHACVTLQRAALNACDKAGTAVPFDLTAAQVGNELRRIDYAITLMEARKTGLEVEALAKLKAGEPVPHYAALPSVGRDRWIPGMEAEVITMGELMGHNIAKPPTPLPIGQVKKLIDVNVIKPYIETPRGELKLVKADTSTTRKLFGVTTK